MRVDLKNYLRKVFFRGLRSTAVWSGVLGTSMLGVFAFAEVVSDDPVAEKSDDQDSKEQPVAVLQPAEQPMVPVLPTTEVEASRSTTEEAPAYDPQVDGGMFNSPAVSGYRAGSSTAGSIMDVPDLELPATVNSITRDLLNDQQALRFSDVIRNAPGVFSVGDSLLVDRIYIRGLEVGSRDFRKDGFMDRMALEVL